MRQIVRSDVATPIRRKPGINVTFQNPYAVAVFVDSDPARLNAALEGVAPDGTQLVPAGGQIQWPNYPGVVYARAASVTFLEVIP